MNFVRPVIDILMTIILLLSMSYELLGAALENVINFDSYEYGALLHEWLGMSLIILFFVHLWLNRWWLKGIFRGRYNLTRTLLTAINILLIADVILITFSGIIMSQIFLELTDTDTLMSFARTSHICASYWGFVLMSFHAGLNWHIFSAMMFKKVNNKVLPHVIALALMIYGGFAFVKRQLWDYMSLNIVFVFFDFNEPFMYFMLDYVAIMILFGCIGHYIILLLRRLKK